MGQIITFYSYKGGTGRSMALANIGVLLAQWGYKVLMVDWDLEAPGLENFFLSFGKKQEDMVGQKGVIDLLTAVANSKKPKKKELDWEKFLINIPLSKGRPLSLLTAGNRKEDYFKKVRTLDFQSFYSEKKGGEYLETLREEWKKSFDFILLDSRTGITDIGGVCTIQLPDLLVLLFTATQQAFKGILDVAKKAYEGHRNWPIDRYSLISIPVPCRFDTLTEFESAQKWLDLFAEGLSDIYSDWLPKSIKPRDMVEITKIPYISYFSFGEKLPVIEQGTNDPTGLGYAYENLSALIANKMESVELLRKDRDQFIRLAQNQSPQKLKFFISYSHKDEAWKDRFTKHLGVLQKQVTVDIWDDRRIEPGTDWYESIKTSLEETKIAFLLISADFLVSDFIRKEEILYLLESQQKQGLRIIPIILSPSPWKMVDWLSRTQIFPQEGKPLSGLSDYEIDSELVKIIETISLP